MHIQKETIPHSEEIKNIYNNFFLPQFTAHINKQVVFLKEFSDLIDIYKRRYELNPKPDASFINDLKLSYHKKSHELIFQKYSRKYKQNFDQDLPEFIQEINTYLKTLDESIVRVQDEERFLIDEKDSSRIKIFKKFKKIFYKISQIPVYSGNLYRRIFKKQLREKKLWYHTIPLRNLTSFYLRDEVNLSFLPYIEEVNKKISSALLEAWKADEEINNISENGRIESRSNIKGEIEELQRIPDDLADSLRRLYDRTVAAYEDAYKKVGTFELPKRKFSSEKVKKRHKELNEEYETLFNGWLNTFYSLFEDWRLNKELYSLNERLSFELNGLTVKANQKFKVNIAPYLNEIKEFLNEVIYRLKEFSGRSSEVKSLFYREKDRIHNKLAENIIPEISEIILAQNIPDIIDQMEYNVRNGIDTLEEKRAIVKTTSYNNRIKDSEIDYISPKEIITYSSLHSYLKESARIKSSIMQELNEIQKGLKDIDQIADFNLESALSMFKSDKSTSEDPLDIAIDGLNRAISKENTVEDKLNGIELKINKELHKAVEVVKEGLISLTKNENVVEIKLNIARTKTLQKTEELKQKSFHFIKNFFPIIIEGIKQKIILVKNNYQSFRRKIGLSPRSVSISTEISDFLAATEIAVSRLPFVYQRLFRIESLEDERFFVGREEELSQLKTAYINWKLKRHAPVIIFGEKGSGTTTLLNFYFKDFESNYNITRSLIDTNIYSEKDFIDFLKNIFKTSSFNSIEEAANYLNDQVTKQIVVIENLQNLYLKKVNGFVCLKMLFELVSKTNLNVFWIITSSLYTWEYLSKIINVPDYFGYLVKLKDLSDEQMINIILKRHQISGYNIYFEPDQNAVKKKYKKFTETEIQEHLKKTYFYELNKFAKSNISLALLYWLRSTKEVTSDTIKLGSVVEMDFSFLKAMNPEKYFILYLLLLHDGLKEEDIVEIYNKPLKEVSLMLLVLLDDGIIIRKGNSYLINPLLYRQIVYLLESKNIIH